MEDATATTTTTTTVTTTTTTTTTSLRRRKLGSPLREVGFQPRWGSDASIAPKQATISASRSLLPALLGQRRRREKEANSIRR